jgi:hypothetical protein
MPHTFTVLTLFSVLFWWLPVVRAPQSSPIMGKLVGDVADAFEGAPVPRAFVVLRGVVPATEWSSLALKVGLNFPSLQDPTMDSSQLRAWLQCARRWQQCLANPSNVRRSCGWIRNTGETTGADSAHAARIVLA